LLLAIGESVPAKVFAHGFFTINGQKISKTIGNVIDPVEWAEKYGSDVVRYFLLREVPFGQDGDVSEEKLKARYEGELANGLGNLLSRVTTLVEKYLDGKITIEKINEENPESEEIHGLIENFKFHDALAKIWQWVAWANKTVDEKKLWDLAKTDLEEFKKVSAGLLGALEIIAKELKPFLPETSKKILDHLNKEKITKADPLFPKV
jgi:methionyl-tRNA synthetase